MADSDISLALCQAAHHVRSSAATREIVVVIEKVHNMKKAGCKELETRGVGEVADGRLGEFVLLVSVLNCCSLINNWVRRAAHTRGLWKDSGECRTRNHYAS